MRNILVISLAVVFLLGAAGIVLLPRHESQGHRGGEFYVEVPFKKVRRVMVRGNCLEEIVAYQHGEVLSQKWEDLDLSMRRLTKWDVDGVGHLIVRVENPEMGTLVLPFRQEVAVREDHIDSKTKLIEPVGYLADYETNVQMVAEGNRTKIILSVSLEYGRRLPKNYVGYMDTKVQTAAEDGWERAKEALTAVIAKHKDRRFVLPLRD